MELSRRSPESHQPLPTPELTEKTSDTSTIAAPEGKVLFDITSENLTSADIHRLIDNYLLDETLTEMKKRAIDLAQYNPNDLLKDLGMNPDADFLDPQTIIQSIPLEAERLDRALSEFDESDPKNQNNHLFKYLTLERDTLEKVAHLFSGLLIEHPALREHLVIGDHVLTPEEGTTAEELAQILLHKDAPNEERSIHT
jgi:hypothetical protein